MSRKYDEWRQCKRKIKILEEREAKRIALNTPNKPGCVIGHYRCKFCGHWHVGNRPVTKELTMLAQEEAPLTIHRALVQSFMRVVCMDVAFKGRHAKIAGPNRSGKTSFAEAILATLSGKRAKAIAAPVHNGKAEAEVHLEIQDAQGRLKYLIDRKWTAGGDTKVIVSAPDGSRYSRPQELLDGLFDDYCLDPSKFLGLKPRDQMDELLRAYEISPPASKVAEITGEQIPADQGESVSAYFDRLIGEKTGSIYFKRHAKGQELARKQKALEERRRVLGAEAALPDRGDSASVGDLLKRREGLAQKREQLLAVRRDAETARRDHKTATAKLTSLKADRETNVKMCENLLAQIAALQKMVDDRRNATAEIEARIVKGEAYCAELDKEAQAIEEAAAKLPDPSAEIAELERQIAAGEQIAGQQAKRAADLAELERLTKEAEEAKEEHGRLGLSIQQIRDLKGTLLDGVALGVPGLQIAEGELLLNKLPFSAASQAEQILVACEVAMCRKPKLRILRLDNAEHLDAASQDLVYEFCTRHGFQAILAVVESAHCPNCNAELTSDKCASCGQTVTRQPGAQVEFVDAKVA
jgi:hypothetical protein